VWFVNEENLSEDLPMFSILRERQASSVIGSYDYFVRTLYGYLYDGLPINYQLTRNILSQLANISSRLQVLEVLQSEHQVILSQIKEIQNEIGNS